jgi:hypothetical protein
LVLVVPLVRQQHQVAVLQQLLVRMDKHHQ